MIQYQIPQTNITRTTCIWQIARKITNEIVGVKGFAFYALPRSLQYLQRVFPKTFFVQQNLCGV